MDEYPWGVDEERAGKRVVMLEKLTTQARKMLDFEKESNVSLEAARMVTRQMLCEDAEALGLPDLEISAAVDEALSKAGTTP